MGEVVGEAQLLVKVDIVTEEREKKLGEKANFSNFG